MSVVCARAQWNCDRCRRSAAMHWEGPLVVCVVAAALASVTGGIDSVAASSMSPSRAWLDPASLPRLAADHPHLKWCEHYDDKHEPVWDTGHKGMMSSFTALLLPMQRHIGRRNLCGRRCATHYLCPLPKQLSLEGESCGNVRPSPAGAPYFTTVKR